MRALLSLMLFWCAPGCSADGSDCEPGLYVPDAIHVIVTDADGRVCNATVSVFENEGEGGAPVATTRFELSPATGDSGCYYEGTPAFDAVELTVLASSPTSGQKSAVTAWSRSCSAPGTRTVPVKLN